MVTAASSWVGRNNCPDTKPTTAGSREIAVRNLNSNVVQLPSKAVMDSTGKFCCSSNKAAGGER